MYISGLEEKIFSLFLLFFSRCRVCAVCMGKREFSIFKHTEIMNALNYGGNVVLIDVPLLTLQTLRA
jgi:hypothetical protein